MPFIEFEKVTKIFHHGFFHTKVTAVDDLSFSVDTHKITGFVGPNGAGKTTSIKLLMGMVLPTRGKVSLQGIDARNPEARKRVGFVSEQPYFYNHLTVEESLSFINALQDLPRGTLHDEIDRVLTMVELPEVRKRKIHQLSKGMQQRLTMAHALMGDPDIYIFDEPMSGLDPLGRRLFRSLMLSLKHRGKTVFFSTHIIDDIELVCDHIIVLSKGFLAYAGPIRKLIDESVVGTEIVIDRLDRELCGFLESTGCSCEDEDDGMHTVLVPNSTDIREIQAFLAAKKIYPLSIQKRRKSLDAVLYSSPREPTSC